jgi:uncharacterized protein (TIGR04376 family)
MGVFDEVSQFLETRLEEFLRQNPQLELQVLLQQIQDQEKETLQLLHNLKTQQSQQEEQLLALAEDIKLWHGRIQKAQQAKRLDLVTAAQQRESELLQQGNQLWGQRLHTLERFQQAQKLSRQMQQRRQEVQNQIDSLKAQVPRSTSTSAPKSAPPPPQSTSQNHNQGGDPLEAEFQRWELDEELNRLKRKL